MRVHLLLRMAVGFAAAAPACSDGPAPVRPDAGVEEAAIDLEAARQTVLAFVSAVELGDKDDIRRHFSFRDLASAYRPKDVLRVSPKLMSYFVDDVIEQMVDPRSPVHRLIAGTEVGLAQLAKDKGPESVVVEGKNRGASLRFYLVTRTGRPQIARIH